MKKCYQCQQSKLLDQFYADKTRKDGRSTKCKACAKTYVKKNIDPNRTHKRCSKCKNELPLSAFSKNSIHDGYQSACKTCRSLIPYQLAPGEYQEFLRNQDARCAICGQTEKLVIDHCHKTNKVRGLLCIKCNWGLGHFEDDATRLAAAAEYLDKSRLRN